MKLISGQGLQRLQQSPGVYRAMHEILSHTQYKLGLDHLLHLPPSVDFSIDFCRELGGKLCHSSW
jgi:hypothetical protein